MAHETMDTYSKLIEAQLKKELVLKDGVVFNNDYEGDPTTGNVKIPVRDNGVTVSDYDKANGISATMGTTTYDDMPINKDKAINEIIDGFDAQSVPDDIKVNRVADGGEALARAIDEEGGKVLVAGGKVYGAQTLTANNVYDVLVNVRTEMSKDNVPNDGKRYLLATPDLIALILESPKTVQGSALGDKLIESGVVAKIAGFNVIEWNDTTANLYGIAGHPKFATRARAFKVPVHLQDLSGSGNYIGASAVQGRDVFGHKVLRNKAIRTIFCPGVTTTSVAVGTSTSGDTKVTATLGSDNSGGSLAYKKNPASTIKYGTTSTAYAGTSMTSGTAKVIGSCVVGDIIEVAEFNSDGACIACAYVTLTAADIKA